MSYPLKDQETNIISEPGTYLYTSTVNGPIFASMQASAAAGSGLIMSIIQTGSVTKAISSQVQQYQQQDHIEIQGLFDAAVGDIFTVSVADLSPLNSVKIIMKINPGLC